MWGFMRRACLHDGSFSTRKGPRTRVTLREYVGLVLSNSQIEVGQACNEGTAVTKKLDMLVGCSSCSE